MSLPPDIIAGSLSDAQRAALIAFCARKNSPYGYYASDLGASGAACTALERKGLLMGGNFYGDPTRSYRWTALGAEVVALLHASDDGRPKAGDALAAPLATSAVPAKPADAQTPSSSPSPPKEDS